MLQLGQGAPRPVGLQAGATAADCGSSSLVSVSAFAAAACADRAAAADRPASSASSSAAEAVAAAAAVSLDVPLTRSQSEMMDGDAMEREGMELAEADAAMQTDGAHESSSGASRSPLMLGRGGSPGGLCIASVSSELASVSLRCNSDGAAERGGEGRWAK